MQQEKKYPIGGYAPGNYTCKCCICGQSFQGDKRAVQCEVCAVKGLTPEMQLIYNIVEQWGNAIEMPNMEQWLKDYAATQNHGTSVWVKAVTIVLDLKGRIAEVFQDTNDALNFCRENRGFTPITHFVTCKSPSKEGNKEQETGQSNKDDAVVDLVKYMQEYIALLGDEINELIGHVVARGWWKSTRHEQGKQLRERITELYNEYQKQKQC